MVGKDGFRIVSSWAASSRMDTFYEKLNRGSNCGSIKIHTEKR